jgi:hypothetical protein
LGLGPEIFEISQNFIFAKRVISVVVFLVVCVL